ncbi:MAG TPA: hypothetical protein VD965_10925 [Burkholderiales bacterium]|nr:hypothetical protein [Burkholderiales bacterium]
MRTLARPPWQAPLDWPAPVSAAAAPGGTRLLQGAIVLALASLTLLDRFGWWVDALDYAVHPGLVALYATLLAALVGGAAQLDMRHAARYVALVVAGGLSYLVNWNFGAAPYVSLGSWFLLVVLYAPLCVSLREGALPASLWGWTARIYIGFMLLVAVAGIGQFFAQFVYRPEWLFDASLLIPPALRGFDAWKGVHDLGGWTKSNGFFLREPSFFSIYMAFGLVLEMSLARRRWVMAVFGLALLLSYSGSGLLILAVALLFPLGPRSLLRFGAAAAVAAVVFLVFGDELNLTYTLDRAGELSSNKSSAYCRFIDPAVVTLRDLPAHGWTALLGHGPGTLHKMHFTCETTFGKVPFEYGLLGALAIGMLMLGALARPAVPVRIRAALVAQWLTQPWLLGPEGVLPIFILCALWPRSRA